MYNQMMANFESIDYAMAQHNFSSTFPVSPVGSIISMSPTGGSVPKSPGSEGTNSSDFSSTSFQFSSSQGSNASGRHEHGTLTNKIEMRRQKNRESAARSRERIKNRLMVLETNLMELEERKEMLINRKQLILTEIEDLENKMLNLSMEKFNSPIKEEALSEHPTPVFQI